MLRVEGELFVKNYESSDVMLSGYNHQLSLLGRCSVGTFMVKTPRKQEVQVEMICLTCISGPIPRTFVESSANMLRHHSFSVARKQVQMSQLPAICCGWMVRYFSTSLRVSQCGKTPIRAGQNGSASCTMTFLQFTLMQTSIMRKIIIWERAQCHT